MDAIQSAYGYLCELDARSLAHVAGTPQEVGGRIGWRGLAYRIGHRLLASRFDDVAEILSAPPATPVPGGQNWLLGLVNVRGNLLPLVDLKMFLEGERTVMHENQRMLTIRQEGGDVGVLIDELIGQRAFEDAEQVDPGNLTDGRYKHLIERAFKKDDETWGVFDFDALTRTPEFRRAAL